MGRPAPLLEVARRFAEYTSGGRPVEHEPWSQGRHHRDGAVRYRLRRRLPSADRRSGRDRVQAGGGRRSVPCPSAAGGAPPAAAGVRRRHDAGRGAPDAYRRSRNRDRAGGSCGAGAVLVDADRPLRFDRVTIGRAAIFTTGQRVELLPQRYVNTHHRPMLAAEAWNQGPGLPAAQRSRLLEAACFAAATATAISAGSLSPCFDRASWVRLVLCVPSEGSAHYCPSHGR